MDTTEQLRPAEAATLLGVGVRTLKRWAVAGQIPAWQTPGGHWRFDAADLTAWREARTGTEVAS